MKKVVIIGAGPAGLSCAYRLLKNNKKISVTIIEEDKQVGGISKTVNHKGNRMDVGGHRFFTKNEEVKKLWLDILPLQGKPSYDDIILKIVDRLKNNIEPSIIGLFEVNVLIYNAKHYIKIEVASGIEKPYYVKSSKQKIYKTRR